MISIAQWKDKLMEDKAKYYNRTRMSLDFFCMKMGISPLAFLEDFREAGYEYVESTRKVEKCAEAKSPKKLVPVRRR